MEVFLQIANTYIKKRKDHTTEKIVIEKEKLVVKGDVVLVIDGKMKEKEIVEILQHSPLTVESNKLFFDKQVRMVVVIINDADLWMMKNVLN